MREQEARIPVRDGSGWRRRSTCPTRRRGAAALPPRGAALPQGRPHLVVRRRVPEPVRRTTGTPCAGSTCAAPARHRATRSTSTRRPSRPTCPTRSPGWRNRSGATARSACGARRTRASTPSRSPASSRPRSRRSARSTPPTTAGPTTCTGAGGALRLVDLVDYDHYMTPMCVLPPVPAVWAQDGEGAWYDEWLRRLDDPRAVGADLAPREPPRPLLGPRLGPAGRYHGGLRADPGARR